MFDIVAMSLFVFVSLFATPVATDTEDPPATQPASTAPSLSDGPLRVEVVSIGDTRRKYYVSMTGVVPGNDFQMQLRLVGKGIADVTRTGRVIFEDVVTDNGEHLISPTTYNEQDRTETFRVRVTPDTLRDRGIGLGTKIDAPSRQASTIKHARGTLKVVMASEFEDVVIKNIASFRGKTIDHPRLKELGIELRVLPAGNPSNMPPGPGNFAFEFGEGQDLLRNIEFFDAWMTKVRAQSRNHQTNEGQPCVVVQLGDSVSPDEATMIVQVYPKIENIDLPVELKEVPLP